MFPFRNRSSDRINLAHSVVVLAVVFLGLTAVTCMRNCPDGPRPEVPTARGVCYDRMLQVVSRRITGVNWNPISVGAGTRKHVWPGPASQCGVPTKHPSPRR